ncbi:hypothetical protein CTI14_71765, partial [Methylobacterium radiotolerans]
MNVLILVVDDNPTSQTCSGSSSAASCAPDGGRDREPAMNVLILVVDDNPTSQTCSGSSSAASCAPD